MQVLNRGKAALEAVSAIKQGGRCAVVVLLAILLTGSTNLLVNKDPHYSTSVLATTITTDTSKVGKVLPFLDALTEEGLDLRAGPVDVPIEIEIPSMGIRTSVLGVGINSDNVMDAPMGKADDPVWQKAFWYRGSAVPGEFSTALIAGHVSAPQGRSGIFSQLESLTPGDMILIHDTRNKSVIKFSVVESITYTLDEMAQSAVLTKLYGAGPVVGQWSQPSEDGLAHLNLITCAGTFVQGTHDHRLVVYATRVD